MNKSRLVMVCANSRQYMHLQHMYRLRDEDTVLVLIPDHLRGLGDNCVYMFADHWWSNKTEGDIEHIEELVKLRRDR